MVIPRRAPQTVRDALDRQAAVALLGPRQATSHALEKTSVSPISISGSNFDRSAFFEDLRSRSFGGVGAD
jgi:predicted ATP-dependent Lon-type protease